MLLANNFKEDKIMENIERDLIPSLATIYETQYKNEILQLGLSLFPFLLINPVLSHGENIDCSEECESMYCPNENSKKEKKDS